MNTILSALLITLVTFIYMIIGEGIENADYLLLASINTLITSWVMFSNSREAFTLQKIINLFIFIFFIVANAVQFGRHHSVLTFVLHFSPSDFISFQLIVSIILICYNGMYFLFTKPYHSKPYNQIKPISLQQTVTINDRYLIYIAIFATLIVVMQHIGNPSRLFMRGFAEDFAHFRGAKGVVDNSGSLLMSKVIRPLPVFALLVALIYKRPSKTIKILTFCALLSNFPIALSRNATAMMWLPIIVAAWGNKFKHNSFMWAMMFALFVLFPFFNVFRRFNGGLNFSWSMDFLNVIDYDASQIFMAVMKIDFMSFGRQLLGVLLFFVPRKFWPDKPIGSGHELVESMHGWFTNVSMPFFAEGYVNFGFTGILLFVIFTAWITSILDTKYWDCWRNKSNIKSGYYYILLGSTIFIMRGDMMSSLAYTIGIFISYSICVYIATSFHFTKIRLH